MIRCALLRHPLLTCRRSVSAGNVLVSRATSAAVAALVLLVCGLHARERDAGPEPSLEVSIHTFIPARYTLSINGELVYANREEHRVLARLRGAQLNVESCEVYMTLSSKGEGSYLVSDWDLRGVLRAMELRDAAGSAWALVDTFERPILDKVTYTIPSIAGAPRTWIHPIGLSRLVRSPGPGTRTPEQLPEWLDYTLGSDAVVAARPIKGESLGHAVRLRITGAGRCAVRVDGPTP